MKLRVEDLETKECRLEFISRLHGELEYLEKPNSYEAQLLLASIIDQANIMRSNNNVNHDELFRLIDYLKKLPCHIC